MLSNSMDALGAFSHLSENLPSWITRLSDLRDHTVCKRQEYIEAFKIHGSSKPPRQRKNSSICSIRTGEHGKRLDPADNSIQGTDTTSRKCAADDPSEQPFVSTRYNIIIHYDGHTQTVLEDIVRCIGTARSNIRRGKMSQLPLTGFRSGGVLSRTLLNKADGDDRRPQKEPPFESADKLLELAHSLCETAAYEFLRVGDCAVELKGVEEKLNSLLGMATEEVDRLGEQRALEDQDDQHEEPEPPPTEEKPSAQAESTKRADDDEPQASGEIEVDDASSSASCESIDLTAFRANRLNRS